MRNPFIALCLFAVSFNVPALAQQIVGRVQSGGASIVKSTVTLYAAGQGAPMSLTQTETKDFPQQPQVSEIIAREISVRASQPGIPSLPKQFRLQQEKTAMGRK